MQGMKRVRRAEVTFLAMVLLSASAWGAAIPAEGWHVQVDLETARQSAGAQWFRTTVLAKLLSRELLPGQTADSFWERGTRLSLHAPADGTWSNTVLAVDGAWASGTDTILSGLPTVGSEAGKVFSLKSLTAEAAVLPDSSELSQTNLAVRSLRPKRSYSLPFVKRDGKSVLFGSDVTRLNDTAASARQPFALQAGVWLDGRFGGGLQELRQAHLTLCDGPSGELLATVTLQAADADAATRLAGSLAGLLRMFESLQGAQSAAARVRDSLSVQTSGTQVEATFTVPADIVSGAPVTSGK